MSFEATYDPEARAAYIQVRDGEVARTVELNPGLLVDVAGSVDVLGVEIIYGTDACS